MKKLLLPTLLSLLLAACQSTGPVADTTSSGGGDIPVVTGSPGGGVTGDPNDPLSRRVVYFDFDSYVIRPDARPLIDAHANNLKQHPETRVRIAGHADERGSREYNLGLGQKRANAVRQALTLLGVRDTQIEAVSLGEESPVCTEASEPCYARNRRGEFLYPGEYR
jgi:peptidoglycan-associated lipoprotein